MEFNLTMSIVKRGVLFCSPVVRPVYLDDSLQVNIPVSVNWFQDTVFTLCGQNLPAVI